MKRKTIAERALELAIKWHDIHDRRIQCEDLGRICKELPEGCTIDKCSSMIKAHFIKQARLEGRKK